MVKKDRVISARQFIWNPAIWGIILAIGICFAATHDPWDGTKWDVASPDIDQPHGNAYKEIYDLRKGVALRMNKEHETAATSSAGGVHKQGSARAFFQDAAPSTQVDTSAFDSGDLGLIWFDSNAAIDNQFFVLTATTPTWTPVSTEIIAFLLASNRTFAGTLTATGLITANNGVTLGAGDDLIGSSTSDITINTNKFTVAGASGNTVIAGTCDITGATEVTGVATLGDASLLKTSAAPSTDAMIVNKKYVDDQIAAALAAYVTLSVYTDEDSNTDAMLMDHAYKAATGGYVSAFVALTTDSHAIVGYVGSDNDPAGNGTKITQQTLVTTNTRTKGIFFAVAKDEYFEVTATSGTPTILWKSKGTLSKPVDQD